MIKNTMNRMHSLTGLEGNTLLFLYANEEHTGSNEIIEFVLFITFTYYTSIS